MPKISQRSNKLIQSPIRKFLPLVKKVEAKGIKVFRFNSGDTDLTPPSSLIKAIANYPHKNIGYAPSTGIVEHVQAWVDYYATFKIKLKPENIIPTVGCAEAMLISLMVAADSGDEIIIFEPFYASYKGFASLLGIKLVPITLTIENNFRLPDNKEIAKKITKKTKAIIIINPNNPTGTIFTKSDLNRLVRLAQQKDLYIISDETYREIVFNDKPISLLQFSLAKQRTILIDSVSKRFSCPGVRIGALVSYNKEIIAAALKIAMMRLSAPTLEQYGLIPILKNSGDYIKKNVLEYKIRAQIVFDSLNKVPGIICPAPQGAFFMIIKLPIKDADHFTKFLLTNFHYHQKTLLITPAEDFYITKGLGKNEIRLALVLSKKEITEAMEILKQGLIAYKKFNDE